MYSAVSRQPGSSTSYSPYFGSSDYDGLSQALSLSNKAFLADVAMSHVAALSAMEGFWSQVAPSGAHRYKLLADTYTEVAADMIRR